MYLITIVITEGPDVYIHRHTTNILMFLPRGAELEDDVSFVVCACVVLMRVVSSRVVTFAVVGTSLITVKIM